METNQGAKAVKHSLVAAALMLSGVYASAQQASLTGAMDYVTTITGQQGVRCGYQYNGQPFSRVFRGTTCPRVVDVEVPQSTSSTLADCEGISPSLYQQCIRAAGPTPLSQCEGLSFDLYQVCVQRAGGR